MYTMIYAKPGEDQPSGIVTECGHSLKTVPVQVRHLFSRTKALGHIHELRVDGFSLSMELQRLDFNHICISVLWGEYVLSALVMCLENDENTDRSAVAYFIDALDSDGPRARSLRKALTVKCGRPLALFSNHRFIDPPPEGIFKILGKALDWGIVSFLHNHANTVLPSWAMDYRFSSPL